MAITYAPRTPFRDDLEAEAAAFFEGSGVSRQGSHALWLKTAVLGAWLFVASDAMLGWGEFVVGRLADGRSRGGPRLRLGVITTYHFAQVLLVLALTLGAPAG